MSTPLKKAKNILKSDIYSNSIFSCHFK